MDCPWKQRAPQEREKEPLAQEPEQQEVQEPGKKKATPSQV